MPMLTLSAAVALLETIVDLESYGPSDELSRLKANWHWNVSEGTKLVARYRVFGASR